MFFLLGTNHKFASIDVREHFFLSSSEQDVLLSRLRCDPRVVGSFILSTCNRTEIYVHCIDDRMIARDMKTMLIDIKGKNKVVPSDDIFYRKYEQEAVRHIFAVSCGLDSLILGEKQILGQVKASFEKARCAGCLDSFLNLLSQKVLQAAKSARHETDISIGGGSVGWAGVKIAEKWLGTLKGSDILIMGAGKMGELAAGHLQRRSPKSIKVMNRTQENAQPLIEKTGGTYVPYFDLPKILPEIDVCLCAVGAPHLLITKDLIEEVVEHCRKPLILIDISMPRNIDPQIKDLQGVKLFCIDDLSALVSDNMEKRRGAVESVENLIDKKESAFYSSLDKQARYYQEIAEGVLVKDE